MEFINMVNNKPNLIRKDSKAGFLSLNEKAVLVGSLLDSFKNTSVQNSEDRKIISDILEKVNNANAINFDYEDKNYLEVK